MTFAELTGAATYIVHLSCKEAFVKPSPRANAVCASPSRRSSSI